MTPKECWEKYGHLDRLMSDPQWMPDGLLGKITLDIWQAVKQAAEEEKHERECAVFFGKRGNKTRV